MVSGLKRFLWVLAAAGCAAAPPDYFAPPAQPGFDWGVPPGFPSPAVPPDNPMSAVKVELGRRLFYDPRLSGNQTFSCASCHRQELAFSDGRQRAIGSTGKSHARNTMSLTNVAYNRSFTWADPQTVSLEKQARIPMFNTHPPELGLAGQTDTLLRRLDADTAYPNLFAEAFAGELQPITLRNVLKAIAAFERTLISADSPYDRLVYYDDRTAFSEAAWRGLRLFLSERLSCAQCHREFNLSGAARVQGEPVPEEKFINTGLYAISPGDAYPGDDQGLKDKTGQRRDMGRFKVPTLRNVAVTAPYMHDGRIADLGAVIDHYAAGGRTIVSGPHAGTGNASRFKDELIKGFQITEQEKADLIAFLHSLTDRNFLTNPHFSDPFE